jgi:hypothetical protein
LNADPLALLPKSTFIARPSTFTVNARNCTFQNSVPILSGIKPEYRILLGSSTMSLGCRPIPSTLGVFDDPGRPSATE